MWTSEDSKKYVTKSYPKPELGFNRNSAHRAENPLQSRIKRLVREKISKRLIKNKILSASPALRNIVTAKRMFILKLLWLLLIVASFSACIYQTVIRIVYYSKEPIVTSVMLETFKQFDLPIINFCVLNSDKLFNFKMEKSFEGGVSSQTSLNLCLLSSIINAIDNVTADELWKLSNSRDVSSVQLFERNVERPIRDYLTISDIDLSLFKCITIVLNKPLAFEGRKTKLVIERQHRTSPCNSFENIFNVYEPGDENNYRSLYFTGAKTEIDVALSYKKFVRLNTANSPCTSWEKYAQCVRKCIREKVQKLNISCRFPFMVGLDHLPVCSNKEDSKLSHSAVWNIAINTDRQEECKCIRVCNERIYSVSRTADNLNLASNKSRLNFFYPTNYYTLIEEKLAYDFIALLCDVGGNLGLYLGLSTIAIIEIVESLLDLNKKSK